MNVKDLNNAVIPIRLHKDDWVSLLEILEFAQVTYAGIAKETMLSGDLTTATNAAIMSGEANVLLEHLQKAGIYSMKPPAN